MKYHNLYRYYWYVHAESDCCFIEFDEFQSSDGCSEQLCEAVALTTTECKVALRKCKWSKKEIDLMIIDCNEPIPF